jgi:hypothetical protein
MGDAGQALIICEFKLISFHFLFAPICPSLHSIQGCGSLYSFFTCQPLRAYFLLPLIFFAACLRPGSCTR